jgi:hypothetical protein
MAGSSIRIRENYRISPEPQIHSLAENSYHVSVPKQTFLRYRPLNPQTNEMSQFAKYRFYDICMGCTVLLSHL